MALETRLTALNWTTNWTSATITMLPLSQLPDDGVPPESPYPYRPKFKEGGNYRREWTLFFDGKLTVFLVESATDDWAQETDKGTPGIFREFLEKHGDPMLAVCEEADILAPYSWVTVYVPVSAEMLTG